MRNSDPGVRIVFVQRHNFWSHLRIYLARNKLQLLIRVQFWCSLGSIWLWCSFVSWQSVFTTGHWICEMWNWSWSIVQSQQQSEVPHLYKIWTFCLVVIAFQFVLHTVAIEDLCEQGHHNPKAFLSGSRWARMRKLIVLSQRVAPFSREGFCILFSMGKCAEKTTVNAYDVRKRRMKHNLAGDTNKIWQHAGNWPYTWSLLCEKKPVPEIFITMLTFQNQNCLADCFTPTSAQADNLITAVKTEKLLDVDILSDFKRLMDHKCSCLFGAEHFFTREEEVSFLDTLKDLSLAQTHQEEPFQEMFVVTHQTDEMMHYRSGNSTSVDSWNRNKTKHKTTLFSLPDWRDEIHQQEVSSLQLLRTFLHLKNTRSNSCSGRQQCRHMRKNRQRCIIFVFQLK